MAISIPFRGYIYPVKFNILSGKCFCGKGQRKLFLKCRARVLQQALRTLWGKKASAVENQVSNDTIKKDLKPFWL